MFDNVWKRLKQAAKEKEMVHLTSNTVNKDTSTPNKFWAVEVTAP